MNNPSTGREVRMHVSTCFFVFMRKILLTLLGIVPLCLFAKGAEDMYMMWSLSTHKQYYFYQQKIDKQRESSSRAFVYDITYADTALTTTYHFSITEPQLVTIDSIAFVAGQHRIAFLAPKQIYIDKVKKGWLHRYEIPFPFEDLKALYQQDTPLHIIAYSNYGEMHYQISSLAKWRKISLSMQQIFSIIHLNKG